MKKAKTIFIAVAVMASPKLFAQSTVQPAVDFLQQAQNEKPHLEQQFECESRNGELNFMSPITITYGAAPVEIAKYPVLSDNEVPLRVSLEAQYEGDLVISLAREKQTIGYARYYGFGLKEKERIELGVNDGPGGIRIIACTKVK